MTLTFVQCVISCKPTGKHTLFWTVDKWSSNGASKVDVQ